MPSRLTAAIVSGSALFVALTEGKASGYDPKLGYYLERRSYGTQRETEPPKYVRRLSDTWAGKLAGLEHVDWLDVGFEQRTRAEYRDNDFRRKTDTLDKPLLLRTRLFFGVRKALDPLRFYVELQDSFRNNSRFSKRFDTRDINRIEPIQAVGEIYFEDALGNDAKGVSRPLRIQGGRLAFEYLDRRLLARNEWRNTTNTFQGARIILGQQKNDWQVDLLALEPIQRLTDNLDQPVSAQRLVGAIVDVRRWSEWATLQPFYFLLVQDGDEVELDANGKAAEASTKIDREIHTLGLRVYGIVGGSGFDWDGQYSHQWGSQDRVTEGGRVDQDHDAYAYNVEGGYTFGHTWKPRLSTSYGFASGDEVREDAKNERFERLFGFARPWSNNDYFQMENIRSPKLRVEMQPIAGLRIDFGYSWYWLASATDRWGAADLRDATGESGKKVGEEVDLRVRFPVTSFADVNLGYARFWAGDFAEATSRAVDPGRRNRSDFVYTEFTLRGF